MKYKKRTVRRFNNEVRHVFLIAHGDSIVGKGNVILKGSTLIASKGLKPLISGKSSGLTWRSFNFANFPDPLPWKVV